MRVERQGQEPWTCERRYSAFEALQAAVLVRVSLSLLSLHLSHLLLGGVPGAEPPVAAEAPLWESPAELHCAAPGGPSSIPGCPTAEPVAYAHSRSAHLFRLSRGRRELPQYVPLLGFLVEYHMNMVI